MISRHFHYSYVLTYYIWPLRPLLKIVSVLSIILPPLRIFPSDTFRVQLTILCMRCVSVSEACSK